jgi:hypothetical protein
MDTIEIIHQNNLSYKIHSLRLRDLIYLVETPCDIYGMVHGIFEIVLAKGMVITKEELQRILNTGVEQFFVTEDGFDILVRYNQKKLLDNTRALSMGDFQEVPS